MHQQEGIRVFRQSFAWREESALPDVETILGEEKEQQQYASPSGLVPKYYQLCLRA